MILLLLQGTQQILLCLSVATWIIEKVVSSITVLFVYTYIFGNKITILFKDVENSIPSYKTSIPFIIPYLHLAFFLSLALSLLPCHPSSWRQPCLLSHPSVSIHQDRIRFSALLTPLHIRLHNIIKQGCGGMISELKLSFSFSIYFCSSIY